MTTEEKEYVELLEETISYLYDHFQRMKYIILSFDGIPESQFNYAKNKFWDKREALKSGESSEKT